MNFTLQLDGSIKNGLDISNWPVAATIYINTMLSPKHTIRINFSIIKGNKKSRLGAYFTINCNGLILYNHTDNTGCSIGFYHSLKYCLFQKSLTLSLSSINHYG